MKKLCLFVGLMLQAVGALAQAKVEKETPAGAAQESQPTLAEIAAERLKELLPALQKGADNSFVANSVFQITCEGPSGRGSGTVAVIQQESDTPGGAPRDFLAATGHEYDGCLSVGSDTITVHFRQPRPGRPFEWNLVSYVVPIAEDGIPLWRRPEKGDVSVLPVAMPPGVIRRPLRTADLLTLDQLHSRVYAGLQVFALGFPLGLDLEGYPGYPMLHVGNVSAPVKDTSTNLPLAIHVFPGDSGGPVYFVEDRDGTPVFSIIGIVTRTTFSEVTVHEQEGSAPVVWKIQRGIGYAVLSSQILEAIAQFK